MNSAHQFPQFPALPAEIRLEIWRLCLPHRIVEVDWPDPDWYWVDGYPAADPLPNGSDVPFPCQLKQTSWKHSAPPLIARVCHEARAVAFEAGAVRRPRADLSNSTRATIEELRKAAKGRRGLAHLHWHPFVKQPSDVFLLLLGMLLTDPSEAASMSADVLDAVDAATRLLVMGWMKQHPRWSVCGALVVVHVADEMAAIRSGLWGAFGDERIVLVDARDAARILAFRDFWRAHGSQADRETKAFFDTCVDGVPRIHYRETPAEFLQDLEVRWIHDALTMTTLVSHLPEAWAVRPGDFDGDPEDPRLKDYGDLPGRPSARQLWVPNREHPLVKKILDRMPSICPTVMFRLCTDRCRLSI